MCWRSLLASLVLLGLVAGAGSSGLAYADDKKPGEPTGSSGQVQNIESRREKLPPIPDFAKSFRLPFESITTLGPRLADARQKCDPIALALIATEIGVAEKVSGKRAELTADDVLNEAVDLARMRQQELELNAVALLVKDQSVAEKLKALAEKAKVDEAERISKFKSGEREKGFHYLVVNNNTDARLSIRVNGQRVGHVNPFSSREFWTPGVEQMSYIDLRAHDHITDAVWSSNVVTGDFFKYTWNLFP
jgi:hypothetical protein